VALAIDVNAGLCLAASLSVALFLREPVPAEAVNSIAMPPADKDVAKLAGG
jgi:hypothetical protein